MTGAQHATVRDKKLRQCDVQTSRVNGWRIYPSPRTLGFIPTFPVAPPSLRLVKSHLHGPRHVRRDPVHPLRRESPPCR